MRSAWTRWADPDDLAQESALARVLADRVGGDPVAESSRAVARVAKAEERHAARFRTNHSRDDGPEFHWVAEAEKVVGHAHDRAARRRPDSAVDEAALGLIYRDTLLLVGRLAGFTLRQLGDATGLTHGQVAAIVAATARGAGVELPGRRDPRRANG